MKNILKKSTLDEIQSVFEKAVQEAFEAGYQLEGKSLVSELDAGDKIRYVGLAGAFTPHVTTGSTYEVIERAFNPHINEMVAKFIDDRGSIHNCSALSKRDAHLFEKVEHDECETCDSCNKKLDQLKSEDIYIEELDRVLCESCFNKEAKSANQQRAELIQWTKRFVNGRKTYFNHYVDFVINAEKRTVVALIRNKRTKEVIFRGIAKCMPGDVFNANIGKAIALARALEIDIPQEFLDAVQPTKSVLGMVVNYRDSIREISDTYIIGKTCHLYSDCGRYGTIIDDTNAEYANE